MTCNIIRGRKASLIGICLLLTGGFPLSCMGANLLYNPGFEEGMFDNPGWDVDANGGYLESILI